MAISLPFEAGEVLAYSPEVSDLVAGTFREGEVETAFGMRRAGSIRRLTRPVCSVPRVMVPE